MANLHTRPIAVVNAGSSSLKFSLLAQETAQLRILAELSSTANARVLVRDGDGKPLFDGPIPACNHEESLEWLFDWLARERPGLRLRAVGHRVVHGGERLTAPALATEALMRQIEDLIPLAPLHQPHNVAPMRYIAARFPDLPQVACFDTAFHAGRSKLERMFALPAEYWEKGVRRYGFHGLSYEYIASRLPGIDARAAEGKTVVCHLGNGASLCALRAGQCVATTMAFTALEGLPMGTRCGAIDPGVLLYLLERDGLSVAQLTDLLYKRSGLLGISGFSADMRELLSSQREEAAEAVEYFCYRVAREIGSLAAALGGIDALAFTGGIGERAAPVRARICALSAWLGIEIDEAANRRNALRIGRPGCAVSTLVVPTDEERMIATHVERLLET